MENIKKNQDSKQDQKIAPTENADQQRSGLNAGQSGIESGGGDQSRQSGTSSQGFGQKQNAGRGSGGDFQQQDESKRV